MTCCSALMLVLLSFSLGAEIFGIPLYSGSSGLSHMQKVASESRHALGLPLFKFLPLSLRLHPFTFMAFD